MRTRVESVLIICLAVFLPLSSRTVLIRVPTPISYTVKTSLMNSFFQLRPFQLAYPSLHVHFRSFFFIRGL